MGWKELGIVEKVQQAMATHGYDTVIAMGPDNFQYLTGTHLPFLYSHHDRFAGVVWPKDSQPVILCPSEWTKSIHALSWIKKIFPYSETRSMDTGTEATNLLSHLLREVIKLGEGTEIGIDRGRVPFRFYKALGEALGKMRLVGCDEFFKTLRMVKTSREAQLLEEAAYRTDHGIEGALHHVLVVGSRYEKGLAEIIRIHCLERGLDFMGYHSVSQAASGEHARKFWPLAPKFGVGWGKRLAAGEMVRLEMQAALDGYWSDAARMMINGDPTPEQKQAYDNLVTLREVAMKNIKPGVPCSQVFKAVKTYAEERRIDLFSDLGVGHGIGVTPHEPPYLIEGDGTPLIAGMILVIDPIIQGPQREIMRSKDTVLVTQDGCKLLGWYKDWREPHIASSAYPSGG
jgi:Xaa-Pro aminopeptidase